VRSPVSVALDIPVLRQEPRAEIGTEMFLIYARISGRSESGARAALDTALAARVLERTEDGGLRRGDMWDYADMHRGTRK